MPMTVHKRFESPSILLRGRLFTSNELMIINEKVTEHYDAGRTVISRKICEELDWRQPNGWLKDRACRDVLVKLFQRGLIKLPSSRKKLRNPNRNLKPVACPINEIEITMAPKTLSFKLAKGDKNEVYWNKLVDYYHYLGHRVTVGKCLKYLVYGDDQLIGCIGFSSPASKLGVRDRFLKDSLEFGPEDIQKFCINNSRFLIFPFVKVKNLASRILSESSEKVLVDWLAYYSVTPTLVETFVQMSRFKGTCYKASNWTELGTTRGFSKKGTNYVANHEPKMIFVYGLTKQIRKRISIKAAA